MVKTRNKYLLPIMTALFSAMAFVSVAVLKISGVGGFLTFDIKDVFFGVTSMMFGPVYGVVSAFMTCLLEALSVSATGTYGFIMNFTSSAIFTLCCGVVYNHIKGVKNSLKGAIFGLCLGSVLTTAAMIPLNLLVTPVYMELPVSAVSDLILPLLLPFNAIKTVLSSSLIMIIYKPVSQLMKRAGVISGDAKEFKPDKKTIIIFVISAALVITCVLLLIAVLGGKIIIFNS